jgi:hypothetical protein
MKAWRSAKARAVICALLRVGWHIKRETESFHRIVSRPDWPDFVFAFHDRDEIAASDALAHC